MNRNKVVILAIILFVFVPVYSQRQSEIAVIRFDELEPYLHFQNDTTYIINFWATWCVPCRKELPYFERIHQEFSGKPVKVLLISLDFPSQIESGLIPFLVKNDITASVILLNDPNSNAWINKVDPSWTGSIPATLIYRNEIRNFYEKELDYETIRSLILQTN
jgi:thiol-disulfide isomerase/thioredoxin